MLFHQDNAPCHKSITTMAKQHKLNFKLLLRPPSNYWLFADLKRMVQGKRFGFNEEVISEAEAKDKSFKKKVIKLLEKHWNESITLERDYVDE